MNELVRQLAALEHPEPGACLEPTAFLDFDHPRVQARFRELDVMGMSPPARAVRLFEFVRDKVTYEFRAKIWRDEYPASYTLNVGCGFCTQKAVVLAALGRAARIPTALVLADLRDRSLPERIVKAMKNDILEYHGFVAFHLDGRWVHADATLSPDVVKRKQYRLVEFDGQHDALLAPTTLDGSPHVEYVGFHGVYTDLPADEILPIFVERFKEYDLTALAGIRYRL